jgi:protein-S-isoprenylcysteine O-methyltransferase Ste14
MGLVLFAGGSVVVLLALVGLGRSASVGIPRGKTALKTRGLYRLSRNPIYVGAFMMCAGSCLFSLHPINIALSGITVGVHHWIITREEAFLETTFGQEWLNYKRRVPRYLGRFKHN